MITRSQLQIFLRLENYVVWQHHVENEEAIDGDFVWELANSIRCLAQSVRGERFKIERFVRDELYATYRTTVPDLMRALFEELGYEIKDEEVESSDDCCDVIALDSKRRRWRRRRRFVSTSSLDNHHYVLMPSTPFSINADMVSDAIRGILEKTASSISPSSPPIKNLIDSNKYRISVNRFVNANFLLNIEN